MSKNKNKHNLTNSEKIARHLRKALKKASGKLSLKDIDKMLSQEKEAREFEQLDKSLKEA